MLQAAAMRFVHPGTTACLVGCRDTLQKFDVQKSLAHHRRWPPISVSDGTCRPNLRVRALTC